MQLSSAAGELLARQIESVTFVQRIFFSETSESNLYRNKKKTNLSETELKFPIDAREVKLATIKFRVQGMEQTWKVDFYLVNGLLFSLVFRPGSKSIQKHNIVIETVQVYLDPMKPIPQGAEARVTNFPVALSGWLLEWSETFPLQDLAPPLEQKVREWYLQQIHTVLPEDYLQMVEQCEGFIVKDCTVFGLSDIYEVHLPHGDYYLLAERGGGFLGVRSESTDRMIYYLHHEEDTGIVLGTSFRDALEYLLARPELP